MIIPVATNTMTAEITIVTYSWGSVPVEKDRNKAGAENILFLNCFPSYPLTFIFWRKSMGSQRRWDPSQIESPCRFIVFQEAPLRMVKRTRSGRRTLCPFFVWDCRVPQDGPWVLRRGNCSFNGCRVEQAWRRGLTLAPCRHRSLIKVLRVYVGKVCDFWWKVLWSNRRGGMKVDMVSRTWGLWSRNMGVAQMPKDSWNRWRSYCTMIRKPCRLQKIGKWRTRAW